MYNLNIDLTCDSTEQECLPSVIADEYWVKVSMNTRYTHTHAHTHTYTPTHVHTHPHKPENIVGSDQVSGLKNVLIDYYVTAVDSKGNSKKSDIYHVYISDGDSDCSE